MAAEASTEGPEALVRRFWQQVFNERDLAAARELVTADFRWRGSLGSESEGTEPFLAYAAAAQTAMPDLAVTLDETAVIGFQVWARLTFAATHHGELLGEPGTGRRVSYVGQAVHDVRNGTLSRVWVVADTLSLYRQLMRATPGGA
jgi:predicted ester cyclase